MNSAPIDINDVNVDAIELRKSKLDRKMGKMYNIFHQGKRLEVILPEMDATFGAKILTDFGKITLPLSFNGMDQETSRGLRLRRAHTKLIEIQQKIRDIIMKSPADFFKDKKKPEIYNERIKDFIVPSVSKEGKVYADVFRLEIQKAISNDPNKSPEELEIARKEFVSMKDAPLLKDKAKNALVVNQDNVEQVIPWGTRIKPVVSFAYLWIMGSDQKCTPKWFLIHGLITSDQKKTQIDLNPDEPDDDEEMEAPSAPPPTQELLQEDDEDMEE